jgi:hypothetical protein
MMLPIPPSFLIEKEGKPHHVSLNFNLAGQSLPPVDAAAMVSAHPKLAVGRPPGRAGRFMRALTSKASSDVEGI